MKYKTPAEAGIARIPPAPKPEPAAPHKRKLKTSRYLLRLPRGQTVEQYLALKRGAAKETQ